MRLQALINQRPHHPYAKLGLTQATDIEIKSSQALDLIQQSKGAPQFSQAAPMATIGGTCSPGDGGVPSCLVGPYDLQTRPLIWISLEGASRYPQAPSAALLAHQLGRPEDDIQMIELAPEACSIPPHAAPLVMARLLDAGPDSEAGKALTQALQKSLSTSPTDALVLMPPVLGMSAQGAAQWRTHLEEATGRTVVELLALEDSVHGFRTWRLLQKATQNQNNLTVIRGKATDLKLTRHQGSVTAASFTAQGKSHTLDKLDGVVLATGRFMGGGVRTQAPITESLLNLPIFAGSEMLDNNQIAPVTLAGERPWSDSRLMMLGVGIDTQCRPLDGQGKPWADNLFVAGRLIGGTNPALDGTTQGVDLITGLHAGQSAAQGGK